MVSSTSPFGIVPDNSDPCGLDLAKFQQTGGVPIDAFGKLPGGRLDVIYVRFSSELQRLDSNVDQERRCREHLTRVGIPHGHFIVLSDEAMSGALESRPGFNLLKRLIDSDRLGMLVTTEQSRLSRGDNVKSLIKDIVFHGGRFISVTEGVDTANKGWKMIVGLNEFHHSRSNDDTAERVRGAQEGRVRDGDGAAGDHPYGYASVYVDPAAAAGFRGRGPKPKKCVVIEQAAAAVVLQVFLRFAADESMSSIVRWWEAHKSEFPSITRTRIHHEHVRRILTNAKYIGVWTFGATTTVRDSNGKKKQVAARADQGVTVVQRPGLRIIEQDLWDRAQARLGELKVIYGMKEGGKKRGPAQHYRKLYDKTLLGGLVVCRQCGATLIVSRGSRVKRLACPNHTAGTCSMKSGVPYQAAQQAILEVLASALKEYPEWMQIVVAAARSEMEQLAKAMPDRLAMAREKLAEVNKRIANLIDVLANGLESPAVRERLRGLESERSTLQTELSQLSRVEGESLEMPPDDWIREQLNNMAGLLQSELPIMARTLRSIVGQVVAEEVLAPGKDRGYTRVRFNFNGRAILAHLLGERLASARAWKEASDTGARSEEFVVDLGALTPMDEWAPKIAQWREEGVKWKEIALRTGLKIANAHSAWKRYVEGIEKLKSSSEAKEDDTAAA